jgi:hypothetical protein
MLLTRTFAFGAGAACADGPPTVTASAAPGRNDRYRTEQPCRSVRACEFMSFSHLRCPTPCAPDDIAERRYGAGRTGLRRTR